ncbi:putative transcriptional regulator ycf27 [Actinoplanes sp. SE50]|uniref:response regulator n=1 Tax=unclassified Actinoplanes TaxID=2626549 RepID=UPI00023ED245|nr:MULTISPECIES: response regulator [unclassified Actinoplanes]AEV84943.1 putative transcriptional regulator ycf27 [Actinoplanes sp. SE50/110]ATO83334.1 putative transcriptional regulator ycf27 [Actinoplanes sp. SE50]SLM00741.1 two-component system response regulator receiver [Actinoplanes sp. SE50/110]
MAVIVVAEDEPDLLTVTERLLRRAGHTVTAVTDGAAAWEAVQRDRPDIVVSDINMPQLSGLELCRRIRDNPDTRLLPVILYSGALVPGDPGPGEVRATAVLNKPFLARELIDCVDKVLDAGHIDGQVPTAF